MNLLFISTILRDLHEVRVPQLRWPRPHYNGCGPPTIRGDLLGSNAQGKEEAGSTWTRVCGLQTVGPRLLRRPRPLDESNRTDSLRL